MGGHAQTRDKSFCYQTRIFRGSIPPELGALSELTHLNLSSNSLTGDIPRELGGLSNLQEIRLSGNSLTGCVPIPAESRFPLTTWSSLNLLYCPPAPEGLTAADSAGEFSVPLSWTAVSNASKYRVEYRVRSTCGYWADLDSGAHYVRLGSGRRHTDGDVPHGGRSATAESEYQFPRQRLSAAVPTHAADLERAFGLSFRRSRTGECVPPTFGATSYTFSVPGDAEALVPKSAVVSATGSGSRTTR